MDMQTLKRDLANVAEACLRHPVRIEDCTWVNYEKDEVPGILVDGTYVLFAQMIQVATITGTRHLGKIAVDRKVSYPDEGGFTNDDVDHLGAFAPMEAITNVIVEIVRCDAQQTLQNDAAARFFAEG